MVRLTKTVADSAGPKARPYYISDGELSGFRLRIFPSGTKSYWACYRTEAGIPRRMSLGRHGPVTCDEARKHAKIVLGDAARGLDPALERRTRRNSMGMAELCDLYIADMKKGLIPGKHGLPKQESTVASDIGRIERHIKPLLGSRSLRDLANTDLRGFLRDVTDGKTAATKKTKPRGKAVVRGGRGTARRTFGLLSGILSYAVERGYLERNPAYGIRRPADGQRTRRLDDNEYKKLGEAIVAASEANERWEIIVGIKLILLSGCRLSEIAKLKWSEVDLRQQCLRLTKTKEGKSLRPVGRAFFCVLDDVVRTESDFVLPGRGQAGHFTELGKGVISIAKRAGFQDVSAHTLRHSYASVAGDLNFSTSTIGAMLGHSVNGTTMKYVHHLDELLRSAADKVTARICTLMQMPAGDSQSKKAA